MALIIYLNVYTRNARKPTLRTRSLPKVKFAPVDTKIVLQCLPKPRLPIVTSQPALPQQHNKLPPLASEYPLQSTLDLLSIYDFDHLDFVNLIKRS